MALRPRFLLLSLMLVAALVCVAVAYWRLRREHTALQLDRETLREELGYLAVYNPKMAYVREGNSYEPLTRKYRVYLPEGNYWLCTREGRMANPFSFMPGSARARATGQFTITVSFRKRDGQWFMLMNSGSSTISDELGEWVSQNGLPAMIHLDHQQRQLAPDKPIPILRLTKRLDDGSDWGLRVFIDPVDPQVRLQALANAAQEPGAP